MSIEQSTCPRHPDVETRLRCSSCEELICPQCWRDAVIGFHCPDCADARDRKAFSGVRTSSTLRWPVLGGRDRRPEGDGGPGSRPGGAGLGQRDDASRLPTSVGARMAVIGLSAAVAGGLLLGPVLAGGAFFLISAGVIGWLVARATFWAAEERSTPLVRASAMTLAGFTVAVALAIAGMGSGIGVLAYPAALWGGWIVVRQR